ncbi:MAG: NAD(P)/FAD-dependent oxidoreductase, partial [Nannocystaceae bacterium]
MNAGASMGRRDAPLPEAVDLAILGGGVMGLATAYELAKRAPSLRICVIEASYLVHGASGRNGGGVRSQWGDPGNVAIMRESLSICRGLAQSLGINLWFRRGGYLFLARSDASAARLARNLEVHRSVGAPTEWLTPREAKEVVPELDVTDVRCATYNPEDGVVFPWPFVWGYAREAAARGVAIRTHTRVDGIEPTPHAGVDGYAVSLDTGESLWAERVVNATGAWSPTLNRMLGIDLPNRPHRHEIISTEPLKPFLDPLVVDLDSGLYFSQS